MYGVTGLALAFVLAAPAATADGVSGTWSVVMRPDELDTCGHGAQPLSNQWLVSLREGIVVVDVLGETNFPRMVGFMQGKELVLDGPGKKKLGSGFAGVHPSSVITLTEKDGAMVGSRLYIGSKDNPAGDGTMLCVTRWSVTAKKLD